MGTQSSQRQTQARGRAICRTCKSCRQKKVKCDSQHPKCGTCRRKNQDCEYPRDGRKTAVRAKKEDIKSLEEQVEELKGQIRRRVTVENAASTDNLHPYETSAHSDSGSRCSRGCPNEPKCDQTLQDQLTCQNNGEKTCADPDPLGGRQIQVYGATSLLPGFLEAPSSDCQSKENNEDAFLRNITQDRLVAFSAIVRPKETIIYSTPSIAVNIDFDGVPVDMAMHLLELHWNRLHLMYLLTYRPLTMDSLFNNGPYINKLLYSDRVPLRSEPDDAQTMGMAFYDRFKALLIHYIDQPSLPTVIALLTCGACLLQYGKQSASWAYCGMAYRMIIDLGYHREDPRSSQSGEDARLSALDKEARRRVYWGAYANDKFQSLYLGRLPGLQQSHGNVPRDFFDFYEELEEWKPYTDARARLNDTSIPVYPGRPSYALSTFQCLLQLSVITETIVNTFYSTKDAMATAHDFLQRKQTVNAQLDRWKETPPAHLLFDPKRDETPLPYQMTLYTTYWTLVILTEQPFLARGHFEFTTVPELQNESKRKCIEASLEIRDLIEAYRKTFSLRRAQYGISYAMYSAVIVLLQHTDQDCDEYPEAIRFFWLALLEYQNGCGHGLKGPLRLLKSLMRRVEKVGQRIDIDPPGTTGSLASNDVQFGIDPIPLMEGFGQGEAWIRSWLNVETDNLYFADDTIFGFFAQE
ncbi:fungal-specific transcription factor domain-containing protein [Aspergillus pseudotamarii]|uniref:Fungal-specific transcription factor domain-containing protein n=1 Tax=Aspergillus pseudotamarii TaxID=132259 RepID=A0A5N6SBF5_ASPPS|nr:fungal-specific transcription factor domain-containing protein [Aspergillus pseudotamarii]KAE8131020.1 fungal-specific transcription factor domain-containing protein [Aspergillus pseudotamarii]